MTPPNRNPYWNRHGRLRSEVFLDKYYRVRLWNAFYELGFIIKINTTIFEPPKQLIDYLGLRTK